MLIKPDPNGYYRFMMTTEDALNKALDVDSYEGGRLELMEERIDRIISILRITLTPEQVLKVFNTHCEPGATLATEAEEESALLGPKEKARYLEFLSEPRTSNDILRQFAQMQHDHFRKLPEVEWLFLEDMYTVSKP